MAAAEWHTSRTRSSQGLTGSGSSKNRLCLTLSFTLPLHKDTDRLFHQLTSDAAYDKRPKLALVALAQNSTAPISSLLPPFRTTLSQGLSRDAKLGSCRVLLMWTHVSFEKKQRSDRKVQGWAERLKNVWAQTLQRLLTVSFETISLESLDPVKQRKQSSQESPAKNVQHLK